MPDKSLKEISNNTYNAWSEAFRIAVETGNDAAYVAADLAYSVACKAAVNLGNERLLKRIRGKNNAR